MVEMRIFALHDIEQRRVSIQRQSPESTDRSPLFQWRDLASGKILNNKTPALRGKARKSGQRGDGLPFE
jgi:hypothetical protein